MKESSAVHIQALYSVDVILPGSRSERRLLVINLASVPGRPLAAILNDISFYETDFFCNCFYLINFSLRIDKFRPSDTY